MKHVFDSWKKESEYLLSLSIIENLLQEGLLNREEFLECKQIVMDEINPPLSKLFVENNVL